MRYLSICSGIEAASVAWEPLGWEPVGFSEIEPFARAVLQHRFPHVPCHGDFTELIADAPAVDVLVGGTPCQAFSVAGRRLSLDDVRGNLSLAYIELANAIDRSNHAEGLPPCITVWENVPGVLSTKDNAFGHFLGGLSGEDGPLEPPGGRWTNAGAVFGPTRAVAWRVLDAQYFRLAQRRRRVFVVSSARDGFDPGEVLLEFDGLRRDSPPRRRQRQGPPTGPAAGPAGRGRQRAEYLGNAEGGAEAVPFLTTSNLGKGVNNQTPLVSAVVEPVCVTGSTTHTLRAEGFDASEDGTGRGQPIVTAFHPQQDCISGEDVSHAMGTGGRGQASVAVAFDPKQIHHPANHSNPKPGDACHPLRSVGNAEPAVVTFVHPRQLRNSDSSNPVGIKLDAVVSDSLTTEGPGAVAFDTTQLTHPTNRCNPQPGDPCHPLAAGAHAPALADGLVVRRLMPIECERLQGFPDDWTQVPIGKKRKPAADGPRYKALGNSMAVPVMRWIGERIADHVELLEQSEDDPR